MQSLFICEVISTNESAHTTCKDCAVKHFNAKVFIEKRKTRYVDIFAKTMSEIELTMYAETKPTAATKYGQKNGETGTEI